MDSSLIVGLVGGAGAAALAQLIAAFAGVRARNAQFRRDDTLLDAQRRRDDELTTRQYRRDETMRRHTSQKQVIRDLQRSLSEYLDAATLVAIGRSGGEEPDPDVLVHLRATSRETLLLAAQLEHEALGERIIWWVALVTEEFAGNLARRFGGTLIGSSYMVVGTAQGTLNAYLGQLWKDMDRDELVARPLPGGIEAEDLVRRLLSLDPNTDEWRIQQALKLVLSVPAALESLAEIADQVDERNGKT